MRQLLVRLSGRQMKRGCEFTEPALLSGLWVLLSAVWLLEHHDPQDLIGQVPPDPYGADGVTNTRSARKTAEKGLCRYQCPSGVG